jgi:hypothetical protein
MTTQVQVEWSWDIENTGTMGYEVLEEPAESFEEAKALIEAYLAKDPEDTCLRGSICKTESSEAMYKETFWEQDADGQWKEGL